MTVKHGDTPETTAEPAECFCCEQPCDEILLTDDGEGLCRACMDSYVLVYGEAVSA